MDKKTAKLLLTVLLVSFGNPMANQQPKFLLPADDESAFSSSVIPNIGLYSLDSDPVSYQNRSEDSYLCGLNETGYVGCSGYGYYQGSGMAFRYYSPQLLAYDGGSSSSCGIDFSRQIICSGYHLFGQLGDGTTQDELTEFVSPLIPTPYQALHLAYGNNNYCAALMNNSIYCWGDNEYGMVSHFLGNYYVYTPTYLQLEINGTIKQLAAGPRNFCALSTMNEIKCWGGAGGTSIPSLLQSNLSNEIQQTTSGRNGTNGSGEGENNTGPLHALDGETIEQIVVGAAAACALTDLSEVYCWGYNSNGIFGTGVVDSSRSLPLNSTHLPEDLEVERLILGDYSACALLINAEIYCWGKSISSPLHHLEPISVGNTSVRLEYSDIIFRDGYPLQLVGITKTGSYMEIEEERISPLQTTEYLTGWANTHLNIGIWSDLFNNISASSFNISVDLPSGLVLNFSTEEGLPYISGVPTQRGSATYTIMIQIGNTSFSSEFEYSFIQDSDGDGIFDHNDEDDDNDGVLDGDDDCPLAYGLSQFIQSGCPDFDKDGYPNLHDSFPFESTQYQDSDSDGFGDNASGNNGDSCPLSFGRSIFGGFFGCWDSDNDGWADLLDEFVNDSSQWLDTDGDGFGDNIIGFRGDACPEIAGTSTIDAFGCPDLDGDGVSDSTDHFPNDHSIWLDSDGDGVDDGLDAFPFEPGQSQDTDGDGYGDNRFGGASADFFPMDPTQWSDIDGDGYGDNQNGTNPDAFIADPTQWSDVDGDGYGDNPAGRQADAFPGDPTQWEDMDGDGLGDNLSGNNPDPFLFDFDNDGYNDSIDPLPKLASPGDMDNDGTPDSEDIFPSDAREWADSDGDGEGDNADTDDDNDGWPDSDEIRAGTDPYSSSSQPVDTFEIVVPGTAIGLGAWDLIGIFGGVPLFAWIGFGFVTRNSRAGKFETRLREAKSRNELEEIATQWEYALMLRLIGPHQGIRLERLRSELDDWFENQSQQLASVGTHDSMHQTHLVENEMDQHDTTKVVPSIGVDSISIPAPSQIADSVDMDGYEWYTSEDGSNFYRTAGSSKEWVKFEN